MYVIKWTECGRTRSISTRTRNKGEATRKFNNTIAGYNAPPPEKEITIEMALTAYIEAKEDTLVNAFRLEGQKERLLRFFGNIPIHQITITKCEGFVECMKEATYTKGKSSERRHYSIHSIAGDLRILRAAINWIYKEGWLSKKPFIQIPKTETTDHRYLKREEIKVLLEACVTDHIYNYVMIGLHTGARVVSILELKWKQVDLDARVIDFNELGREQTNKYRAAVPINDFLYKVLLEARKASVTDYVIEYGGERVLDIKKGFAAACKRAGLKEVTPKTLRKTAATIMMQKGVDIWKAAGVLGHKDITMIQSVYAKHHPDALKSATDVLGDLEINLPTGKNIKVCKND